MPRVLPGLRPVHAQQVKHSILERGLAAIGVGVTVLATSPNVLPAS
jgi:hypothetical protein